MIKKTDRKDDIKEALIKILETDGVKGLTTARIAEEVGFSDAAIFKYFKNKDAILDYALQDMLDIIKEIVNDIDTEFSDPMEKILNFAQLLLTELELKPGFYRLIYSDELHIGNEDLMSKLREVARVMYEASNKFIIEAIKQGRIIDNIDVEWLSMGLYGCIHSAFMAKILLGKKESIKDMAMKMMNITLMGVTTQ
ncbi:MAG TPA: TetR/AcrR family transcriptional regulator [bacterium]|nr:TetR/AcrR family transcriptional regulator [bacterium]